MHIRPQAPPRGAISALTRPPAPLIPAGEGRKSASRPLGKGVGWGKKSLLTVRQVNLYHTLEGGGEFFTLSVTRGYTMMEFSQTRKYTDWPP